MSNGRRWTNTSSILKCSCVLRKAGGRISALLIFLKTESNDVLPTRKGGWCPPGVVPQRPKRTSKAFSVSLKHKRPTKNWGDLWNWIGHAFLPSKVRSWGPLMIFYEWWIVFKLMWGVKCDGRVKVFADLQESKIWGASYRWYQAYWFLCNIVIQNSLKSGQENWTLSCCWRWASALAKKVSMIPILANSSASKWADG